MKLTVGICDDEKLIAEHLKEIVSECLHEKGQKAEIRIFLSGKLLLKEICSLDVVFLDVRMEEMDGYETGRQIGKSNPDCRIIMETGENENFEKAFEIGALRYIRKPFDKEKVKEALDKIINELEEIRTIELFKDRKKYVIKQKKIKYIRAYNGYTEYYAGGEIFRKEVSLSGIEPELESGRFFKVHKQYIVNVEYVSGWKDGKIYIDEMEIPVSRRKKSEFEKVCMDYWFAR